MMLRGLAWLMALAALAALLIAQSDPSDPVRAPANAVQNAPSPSAILAYTWAELDPRVGELLLEESARVATSKSSRGALAWVPAPGSVRPASRLAIYAGAPHRTQALAAILTAVSRADAQNLDRPALIEADVILRPPPDSFEPRPWLTNEGLQFGTLVLPTGTRGLTDRLQVVPHSVTSYQYGLSDPQVLSGSVLTSSSLADLAELEHLWQVGRGSVSWFKGQAPQAVLNAGGNGNEFHPVSFLRPHSRLLSHLISALGHCFDKDLNATQAADGFYCLAPAWQQAAIRQLLTDPRLIRLALAIDDASAARRDEALREALWGDDPLLADLATECPALGALPADAVEACPHRLGARRQTNGWHLRSVVTQLPPAAATRFLDRLAESSAPMDYLWIVFGAGLTCETQAVRAAAERGVLQRLTVDSIRFATEAGEMQNWPLAERERFVLALADRLRENCLPGRDEDRILMIVGEAVVVTSSTAAWSRLQEVAAMVILAAQRPADLRLFQRQGSWACEEAGRNSNPEVRRQAWKLRRLLGPAPVIPLPSEEGDPYLADLIREESTRTGPAAAVQRAPRSIEAQ